MWLLLPCRCFSRFCNRDPDVNCVIHTHTKATEVLSSLGCELLPMSHPALMLHKRTGYVDYAFFHDDEFCRVMVEAFKGNVCLLMRNHGMMAVGHTPAAAFFNTVNLDQACAVQLAAYQSGRGICFPEDTDRISQLYVREIETGYGSDGSLQWAGGCACSTERTRPTGPDRVGEGCTPSPHVRRGGGGREHGAARPCVTYDNAEQG